MAKGPTLADLQAQVASEQQATERAELSPYDATIAALQQNLEGFMPKPAASPALDVPLMPDGRVPVAFRDGKHGTIAPEDIEKHISLGGSFLKPEQYAQEKLQFELDKAHKDQRAAQKKEANKWTATDALGALTNPFYAPIKALAGGEQAQAFEQGFVRGGTLGLSDAAILGLNVGGDKVPGLIEVLKGKPAADAARQYMNVVDQENSGYSGAGEFVGTIANVLATGGLAGGAGAAESVLTGLERKGAEIGAKYGLEALGKAGAKIGANMVRGAPINAAFGAGHEISKAALDNDQLMAEHVASGALKGLLEGAVVDLGLGAGGALLGAARKEAQPLIDRFLVKGDQALSTKRKEIIRSALDVGDDVLAIIKKDFGPEGEDLFYKKADKLLREKPTAKWSEVHDALSQDLSRTSKAVADAVRAADDAGITVGARDLVDTARAAVVGSTPEGVGRAQQVVDTLAERSGLKAEQTRLTEQFTQEAEALVKQENEELFGQLADADILRIDTKSKIEELQSKINRKSRSKFPDAVAANTNSSSLERQLIKQKQLYANANAEYSRLAAEAETVLMPAREAAAAKAIAEADVVLPFSQARELKNVLREGIDWHQLPEPVKQAWQKMEGHIEGIAERAGEQLFGKNYKGIKAEYGVTKELLRKVAAQTKASIERGSVLEQAMGNVAMGSAFGSLKGAVTAGAIGAAKGIAKEYGPRLMVDIAGRAQETQALAKLVGYTDLALQSAVLGAGTAAKAEVLSSGKEPTNRRELFQHRVEQIEKYKEDPDRFLAALEKQLVGLSPEKRQAILLQADKTLAALAARIPASATFRQDPLAPQVKTPVRTTDSEMRKFLAQYDAAMDPTTAYKAMTQGRLRQDQIDIVKEVTPLMDQRAQFILGAQIANATERPAGKVRGSITKVMSMPPPVSATPEYAARIRGVYGPLIPGGSAVNDKAPSQLASRPQMSFQKNPTQRMTTSQSLEFGEK